jgi:hypothetical protein
MHSGQLQSAGASPASQMRRLRASRPVIDCASPLGLGWGQCCSGGRSRHCVYRRRTDAAVALSANGDAVLRGAAITEGEEEERNEWRRKVRGRTRYEGDACLSPMLRHVILQCHSGHSGHSGDSTLPDSPATSPTTTYTPAAGGQMRRRALRFLGPALIIPLGEPLMWVNPSPERPPALRPPPPVARATPRSRRVVRGTQRPPRPASRAGLKGCLRRRRMQRRCANAAGAAGHAAAPRCPAHGVSR